MRAERGSCLVNWVKSRRLWWDSVRTGSTPSCTHTTMTKRDDKSLAEQNAEIRRWAEENGFTVGSRLGEKQDAVELVAPRVPGTRLAEMHPASCGGASGESPVMRMRCDTLWVFPVGILAVTMIRVRRVVRSSSLGA